MIDCYRGDVFLQLILDERRREAAHAQLMVVYRQPGLGARIVAMLGKGLVNAGTRLQRVAGPAPRIYAADPCHGCAN